MFTASEIILNPDGSVYHLHLLPHQLADTVITVGDPARVKFVSRHFSQIEHKVEKREFITHTGYYKNKRITVISTGIGTDNMDIVINEIHILKNVDLQTRSVAATKKTIQFFRIGTSGSIQPDIPADSFVVSHYAIGLDNLMHFYAYTYSEVEKKLLHSLGSYKMFPATLAPYVVASTETLRSFFEQDFFKGITITSPGFYGPQSRNIFTTPVIENVIEDLQHFTFDDLHICNFEMESSALFGLANLYGHQAISVNAILANRANGTYSSQPEKTISALILKCLDIIAEIP